MELAPVTFRWGDREMTAHPPEDLTSWGRKGHRSKSDVAVLAQGLAFLRAVLDPADYGRIHADVRAGIDLAPVTDLVRHLVVMWVVDPATVAPWN